MAGKKWNGDGVGELGPVFSKAELYQALGICGRTFIAHYKGKTQEAFGVDWEAWAKLRIIPATVGNRVKAHFNSGRAVAPKKGSVFHLDTGMRVRVEELDRGAAIAHCRILGESGIISRISFPFNYLWAKGEVTKANEDG